jgi:uncharacterized membrane protein YcaP (DUF421 family)
VLNWHALFVPDIDPLVIFVRTTVLYLVVIAATRLVLRRQVGGLGPAELLVVVLLGDASQNAMTGGYQSVTDGLVIIATLFFWTLVIDALAFRFSWFERIVEQRPLRLIRHGRLDRDAQRRELLSDQELMSELRKRGLLSVEDVEEATIEPSGELSVIPRSDAGEPENRAP